MTLPRVLAAALLLGGATLAVERPTLVDSPRGLSLARLPPVLDEPAVARHLGTGLTTVLLLTVEGRGGSKLSGGARLTVRYDLWDEVYVLGVQDAEGDRPSTTVSSRDALLGWWRGLTLRVRPASASPPLPREARVRLQVLPFSQAEQQDAQEWLLRSFRAPDPGAPPPLPESPQPPREPVRDFYGAMLASSIGRRSLITYSWTVPIGGAP